MPYHTDTIVIGAGQAGLAMSRCLSGYGIDHVVLDRGAIADRWRTERWASLRLLTPNWMTRLPGFDYAGPDPCGFMHKDEVTAMLRQYARSFRAPVREFTTVISVSKTADGFRVVTDGPTYAARSVVIATGACDTPKVPGWAKALPVAINQVTTNSYVHPGQLDEGKVLVIGGSATGVQLAEEIHRSGRPVTLACGSHVCVPRRYRGRDIMRWMDMCGLLSEPRDPRIPAARAMAQPSLQLVGSRRPRTIGLGPLAEIGVRCVSRVDGIDGATVSLSGDLATEMARAKTRCDRILGRIDAMIDEQGHAACSADPIRMTGIQGDEPRTLDLARDGIRTILWATGFRRTYPWLDLPVLDAAGELRQHGGLTAVPGLYALGLPFMRRRNSTFIDGVGADARDLAVHLSAHLGCRAPTAA